MKFEDLVKYAKHGLFPRKLFQILLNQNLGVLSMDNNFSGVLEGVEGCFKTFMKIFSKNLAIFSL